jgi:hypothetical protein
MLWSNPRSGIAHRYEDATRVVLLGADRQLSCPLLNRAHCFDSVQDQVQDNLLQLNAIHLNIGQPLGEAGLERDSIVDDCVLRQRNHIIDRLIKINPLLSRRSFLDVIPDPVEDISGSIGIIHDAGERFPDLAKTWRASVQEVHRRAGVVARGGNRLRDFVGQRGGQFSHHAQAVHVREIGLELA